MTKIFQIRKVSDTSWVPDHPELEDKFKFMSDDPAFSTLSAIRAELFRVVDRLIPNTYTLGEPLQFERQEFFQRIDKRTFNLIESGFTYQDLVFSCSERAQIRYNGMLTLAEGLTYPLEINTLDDLGKLVLANAEETVAFCIAAANYVREQVDRGTILKEQVRSAQTQEEIDAIVDDRETPEEQPEPLIFQGQLLGS